jgi:glucuronoarabinoxylan endo-1,4-beta-xylanase
MRHLKLSKLLTTILAVCLLIAGCSKGTEQNTPVIIEQPKLNSSAIIDGNTTYQTIDGFGFSSAWCGTLSSAKNNALYKTLGFSLLRIRIDQNKAYWGDEISNSAAAHTAGAKVLGSEWSPPAAWNSNGQSVGGYLLPEHYNNYANYLKDAANTIGLDWVSFQNEPDMGYIAPNDVVSWSASQMKTFLKNNSATIGKPIVYAESFSFNDEYTDIALNDSSTVNKIAIVGGHIYGSGLTTHQNAINKGKHVWMTEHYIEHSRNQIDTCLILAKEIMDCMNNQMNAYFFWWVADFDTSVNLVNNSGDIYKAGYTGGQFAKWIRPGMMRIGTTYNPLSGVYITAYQNKGTVIVAVNTNTTSVSQSFALQNIIGLSSFNVHRTSDSENMASKGTVSISNNSFIYTLPAKSITTFHSTD